RRAAEKCDQAREEAEGCERMPPHEELLRGSNAPTSVHFELKGFENRGQGARGRGEPAGTPPPGERPVGGVRTVRGGPRPRAAMGGPGVRGASQRQKNHPLPGAVAMAGPAGAALYGAPPSGGGGPPASLPSAALTPTPNIRGHPIMEGQF